MLSDSSENIQHDHGGAAVCVQDSLRGWCVEALNSAPSHELSLERLRDICRGTAAAEGEADVEPIDVGRIAHALLGASDWEIVCRPSHARRKGVK